MILKCMNSDFNKWMRELLILKKSLNSNLVRITDSEARLLIWRRLFKICMDLGKEKVPFMLSWIIWKPITKSWFSFLKLLASIKTVKILKLWEELSTCLIRVSPIFAKPLTSSQTKLQQEEQQRRMEMLTNGFQLKLSKRLKKFKTLSILKWLKHAFLKFFTSSTWSGETSWEKKMNQSRRNTLYKFKISEDNSWPKKHLMKMSLKEIFLVLRKKFNS